MVKKYLSISEVSKVVGLEEHTIRYWDSIDPKTKKFRVEGISTKSKSGTRYFNRENINKLQKLKSLVYSNGEQNKVLNLANKFIHTKGNTKNIYNKINLNEPYDNSQKTKKIAQILKKIRILIK
tara:strand:+ start:762 stop:1133 length:372 start_codon:yes stop_codon:yes gene_type:complete